MPLIVKLAVCGWSKVADENVSISAPPRNSRFGSPLELSRVHWVEPELVVEVKYLAWTGDNLLRQVVYEGLREDKPPADVRRELPHPNVNTPAPKNPAPPRR